MEQGKYRKLTTTIFTYLHVYPDWFRVGFVFAIVLTQYKCGVCRIHSFFPSVVIVFETRNNKHKASLKRTVRDFTRAQKYYMTR